jgi:hypothetical protein
MTVVVHVGATGNFLEQNACAAGESDSGCMPAKRTLVQTLPEFGRPPRGLKLGAIAKGVTI